MGIKVTKTTPTGTGPRTPITLLPGDEDDPAGDEFQADLKAFERELRDACVSYSPQAWIKKDAQAITWLTGHFQILLSAPVLGFLGAWVQSRRGRKIRLKVGEVEAEATSVDEIERLLDKAKEFEKR